MVKNIIDNFKNLEEITHRIIRKGLSFCFILCIIATTILLTYTIFSLSPNTYYIGLALFKLSTYFMIDFIVCGFVVDNINKQLN